MIVDFGFVITIFESNFCKVRTIKFSTIAFLLFLSSSAWSQTPAWSTLEYYHSNGPVSPEYQYNYSVIINEDGFSKLVYTNKEGTKEYEFNIPNNKKGMKKLDQALKSSKVFDMNADEMKSDDMLIGGRISKLSITLWQDPMLDQPPQKIEIPSNVKQECQESIDNLYSTIMSLVPDSIKAEAGIN